MNGWGYGDYTCVLDEDGSPPFPPEQTTAVRERTVRLLGSNPREWGVERTRWRLADRCRRMIGVEAKVFGRSGLRQVLRRLGIRYRRGWAYLVSPDPLASLKLEVIDAILQRAHQAPGQ